MHNIFKKVQIVLKNFTSKYPNKSITCNFTRNISKNCRNSQNPSSRKECKSYILIRIYAKIKFEWNIKGRLPKYTPASDWKTLLDQKSNPDGPLNITGEWSLSRLRTSVLFCLLSFPSFYLCFFKVFETGLGGNRSFWLGASWTEKIQQRGEKKIKKRGQQLMGLCCF